MTEFIHTGDIHLGSKFNAVSFGAEKGRRRREEIWSSFRRLISYTVNNGIKIFLIAGDLYEADTFTRKDLMRLSELLEEAKSINFVMVEGNHDMAPEYLQGWKWSENVTLLKSTICQKVIFDDLGVAVHGIGWEKAADSNVLLNSISREPGMHNILLIHGDALGSSKYMPVRKNLLDELKMDYVALGHIHKPMFISENMAYCGSLEGLDFGESGEHGFVLGHLSKKSSFEFIPFSSRRFHIIQLEIRGDMRLNEISDKAISVINGRNRDDFFRLVITGTAPIHFNTESLKHELVNECYHLEILDDTVPDFDIRELLKIHSNDIIGSFISSFTEEDLKEPAAKRALHVGLLALMEGGAINVYQRA